MPHSECVHFIRVTQEAAIISRKNIMQSLFVLDPRCVYCEVGTELFFITDMKVCTNRGRLVALLTGFVTVSAKFVAPQYGACLHFTLLAPRIWRWVVDFWKICTVPDIPKFQISRNSQ